jgi:hypothetical protein
LVVTTVTFLATVTNAAGQQHLGPVKAVASATVQPAGPLAAPNGTNSFNVLGNNYAANASFGTADFGPFTVPGTVFGVGVVHVFLTESNAAFSTAGPVLFDLASNTTTPVTPGASTPNFIPGGASGGVGNQFGTLLPLGLVNFPTTGNPPGSTGRIDTFDFFTDPTLQSYILTQLNSGGAFRLVIAPEANTVAATWAGFSNTTTTPDLTNSPRLSFDVSIVPEPTSLAFMILAGPAICWVAVRRHQRAVTNARRVPPDAETA